MKQLLRTVPVLLIFLPGFLCAESLEELFSKALQHNPEYRSLALELENARIDKAITDLSTGYSLSIGTDSNDSESDYEDLRLKYSSSGSSGDGGTTLSAAPTASFGLDEPLETEFSLSVPFEYNFNDEEDSTFYPGLTITQPIHDLLGIGDNDDLEEAEDRYDIIEAQVNLYEQAYEIKTALLEILENLFTYRQSALEAKMNILSARESLEELVSLRSFSEESYEYRQKVYDLSSLQRGLDLAEKQYANEMKLLAILTGAEIGELPAIPYIEGGLMNPDGRAVNPDLYLAEAGIEVARLEYQDEVDGIAPELYLVSGYSARLDCDGAVSDHDLSGGISAVFEDFSISTSVGYIFDVSDGGEEPYITTAFNWSMPDTRDDKLTEKKLANSIETAKLDAQTASETLEQTRLSLVLEAENQKISRENVEEELSMLRQKISETESSLKRGIGTETDYESARYELEIKKLDDTILAIQELSTRLDWQQLYNFIPEDL